MLARTARGYFCILAVRAFLLRLPFAHGHSSPCANRLSDNCSPPMPAIPVSQVASGSSPSFLVSSIVSRYSILIPKIRLSSDSASRRTPLPLANPSRYRADSGLSPYRTCAHWAHIEAAVAVTIGSHCCFLNQSSPFPPVVQDTEYMHGASRTAARMPHWTKPPSHRRHFW